MYSTSELDELFQILNSVKGFKLNNHKGATQQYGCMHVYMMLIVHFVCWIVHHCNTFDCNENHPLSHCLSNNY